MMNEKIVSRETLENTRELYQQYFEELEAYLEQLLWWNEKVNLVSREVSRETVREHIVHSLIPQELNVIKNEDSWIDAGTGGGLPGIPLAITGKGTHWILNDIVSKKVAALKQMIFHLNLSTVKATADSVEKLLFPGNCGVITKHAFKTDNLLRMIKEKSWKKLVLMKGVDEAKEEFQKLDMNLKSILYRFEFGDDEPFYEGKGLMVIEQ
ncbi:MAG: RsmG family class I SAM-dependent methyltransferase [Balneolaceae bacterium]